MADLKIIDDITNEISKIRGVDLPPICIKIMVLTYICYACNTYDIRYKNEDGATHRPNVGCLILAQKGTGKSRTLKALKKMFYSVEEERIRRYKNFEAYKIGKYKNSMIPLTGEQQKEVDDFYRESGREPVSIFDDPITAKGLCCTYAQTKTYKVNNILYVIDEVGERLFKDAMSNNPSISSKEFTSGLTQLFYGACHMGQSKTSKEENITSQTNIGANFIFVSTAEFLKDRKVQEKYKSYIENGVGRRLLFINCPPLDEYATPRKRYFPNFEQFEPEIKKIFGGTEEEKKKLFNKEISASEELWINQLEKQGSGANLTMGEEFLLLLFCTGLVVWTGDSQIQQKHWDYMINTFNEMKKLSLTVAQKDTTNYDKICIFIKSYLSEHSNKKKISIALIKDYCLRNRMCYESTWKKWFNSLIEDFKASNDVQYLIERNQLYAWLEENYAYEGK